jgi:hypothetical protein
MFKSGGVARATRVQNGGSCCVYCRHFGNRGADDIALLNIYGSYYGGASYIFCIAFSLYQY